MFSPENLEAMMERAKQVEDKNWLIDIKMGLRPGTRVTRPNPKAHSPNPNFPYFPSFSPNPPAHSNNPATNPKFQPVQSATRPNNFAQPMTHSNPTHQTQNISAQSFVPRQPTSTHQTEHRSNKGATSSVTSTSQPPRERTYRRLLDDEFRTKIEKGLYFRCDDIYYPGHRCKN